MKYNEIKGAWIGIAKFLGCLWLATIIFAGLYFVTKWTPLGLLGGLFFLLAVCFTIPTIVYNLIDTGKTVVSHTLSEDKTDICDMCEKKGKTSWSGALRVCDECKEKLESSEN